MVSIRCYNKLNEYITLKLKKRRTNIYIQGKLFNQCKRVVFNLPTKRVEELDEIDSIDEAIRVYNRTFPVSRINILPEQEFMAHCSNLQVWVEHDYDTRLLHSNLAFPLLKKLVEVGDPLAKKVFKEEITTRFESGYPSVQIFLVKNNYLNYFTIEELTTLFQVCMRNKDFHTNLEVVKGFVTKGVLLGDKFDIFDYPLLKEQFKSSLKEQTDAILERIKQQRGIEFNW